MGRVVAEALRACMFKEKFHRETEVLLISP